MSKWSKQAKRILKAELVKRGLSNSELAERLNKLGLSETKSSIDSKISRGTFSASFLLQCFEVLGCKKIEIEDYSNNISDLSIAAEELTVYKENRNG